MGYRMAIGRDILNILRWSASGRDAPAIDDVRAAVGRVDRASGRAPWLGSRPEAMRLSFLAMDDGLRRVLRAGHD